MNWGLKAEILVVNGPDSVSPGLMFLLMIRLCRGGLMNASKCSWNFYVPGELKITPLIFWINYEKFVIFALLSTYFAPSQISGPPHLYGVCECLILLIIHIIQHNFLSSSTRPIGSLNSSLCLDCSIARKSRYGIRCCRIASTHLGHHAWGVPPFGIVFFGICGSLPVCTFYEWKGSWAPPSSSSPHQSS